MSAGGKGEHGDDGGQFASDATYSNGIIVVSQSNNFLATTNTKSGTVALFKIDPNDPTNLEMAGQPVSSQGDFPTSVAFRSVDLIFQSVSVLILLSAKLVTVSAS